jgi:predicted RNA binding protein YcfA (HicA-like mRNA interferase family)
MSGRKTLLRCPPNKQKRPTIKPERLVKQLERNGCEVIRKCKRHYAIIKMPGGERTTLSLHPSEYTIKRLEKVYRQSTGTRIRLKGW